MAQNTRPDRLTVDALPPEIKRIIIQHTAQADTARLARTNTTWREQAEEKLWVDVEYGPEPDQEDEDEA